MFATSLVPFRQHAPCGNVDVEVGRIRSREPRPKLEVSRSRAACWTTRVCFERRGPRVCRERGLDYVRAQTDSDSQERISRRPRGLPTRCGLTRTRWRIDRATLAEDECLVRLDLVQRDERRRANRTHQVGAHLGRHAHSEEHDQPHRGDRCRIIRTPWRIWEVRARPRRWVEDKANHSAKCKGRRGNGPLELAIASRLP